MNLCSKLICLKFQSVKGIVSIEFIFVLSLFVVPLFLGTIEIGRIFYQYNTLVKSVRDSAKFISVHRATDANYLTRVDEAKCIAAFGNTKCTGMPLLPKLSKLNVAIGTDGNGAPLTVGNSGTVIFKLITVKLSNYQLGYVTSFITTSQSYLFNDISVSMRQAQ